MRVLVAMSGGVDSSVAAALLVAEGHEVVGATLKLWGGPSDSGCCSLADTFDARRVADQLGIDHRVFNYSEDFDRHVVAPYVQAHLAGETPNPCVECNRHLKFGALLARARRLGFDALATGHHARVRGGKDGPQLLRGKDHHKDQSYVLSVLSGDDLAHLVLPVGELTKDEVRSHAARLGLGVATKPDSQEVCFIASGEDRHARRAFLAARAPLHRGVAYDTDGTALGEVEDLELLTVGQRKGLGTSFGASRRYVRSLDVPGRRVVLGRAEELTISTLALRDRTSCGAALAAGREVDVQTSAHGAVRRARLSDAGLCFLEPVRAVAPGQVVALYDGERVLGSAIASR